MSYIYNVCVSCILNIVMLRDISTMIFEIICKYDIEYNKLMIYTVYVPVFIQLYVCNRVTSKVMSSLHVNIQFIKALDFVDMKAPGLSRCRDVVPQPQRDPFSLSSLSHRNADKKCSGLATGPLFC